MKQLKWLVGSNEEILLKKNEITLECCLTSNLLCKTVTTYSDHHFWRFFRCGHPVVICVNSKSSLFVSFSLDFYSKLSISRPMILASSIPICRKNYK